MKSLIILTIGVIKKEDLGKQGEKIIQVFDLALSNVFQSEIIPPKSQELITVEIPKLLHRPLVVYLNHVIRKKTREHGTIDLNRKVYLE